MGELRPWHIAVLVVVLILLFGSKRLPDAARGLGRSMRILKAETKGLNTDDDDDRYLSPEQREVQRRQQEQASPAVQPETRRDDTTA